MTKTDIINLLIAKNGYQFYLEIGVSRGKNFKQIDCPYKVGVDVVKNQHVTHQMTSDEFFEANKEKFDIVLIDGLHIREQVKRDILNSLKCLNRGGVIVCHDMNPVSEIMQRVPRESGPWNGDCWKAWIDLRQRKDLSMWVVDTNCGCGIIRRGKQGPIKAGKLTYENLKKHRVEWLNLISVDYFKHLLKSGRL